MKSICVYSSGTLEHALGHLRIGAPLNWAGVQVYWRRITDELKPQEIAASDLVVIQRDFPRNLTHYAEIVRLANFHRKPIVFEIDDLLWDLPPDHPDRLNNHYLDALWPMLVAALQADAVVVTTPKIQTIMRSLVPSDVYLLPNYLDDGLWEFRQPVVRDDAVVRIGYMGGDSHAADVQMIAPALERILQQYPSKVQLVFWGLESPYALRSSANVEWHPLNIQDYGKFADYFLQQDLDIFLAPLALSRFNQSKSPIKYFECTALGAAGVCSDITPYKQVVEHGKTGYLASTLEAWVEHLAELIEKPDLRLQIVRQAQEYIQQTWLLSNYYHEWPRAYQQMIDQYQSRDLIGVFDTAASIKKQWTQVRQADRKDSELKILDLENQLAAMQSGRVWKLLRLLRTRRKRLTEMWRDRE